MTLYANELTVVEERVDPALALLAPRLARVIVRGGRFSADVAEAVTSAVLSLSVDEVSQLTIKLLDDAPDFRVLRSELFDAGTPAKAGSRVEYDGLRFDVRAVELAPRGAQAEVTVTARSLGAGRLRRERGAKVSRGVSPTQFAKLAVTQAGLRFVGQPSPGRKQVARQKDETTWETLQRLASELGFVCFETTGVVYFGKPTWIIRQTEALPVRWAGGSTDDSIDELPRCRRSGDDAKRAATVEVKLRGPLGDAARPGMRLELTGVPGFAGDYMVTGVDVDLARPSGGVRVTASTPINPKPQPPQRAGGNGRDGGRETGGDDGRGGSTTSAGGGGGVGTASRFVAVALAQAGDTYIYGAEASASDPDPDAFDCSELVQWALARAGVTFVDGSSAQIAACRRIPVEQAIRTRGALLHHPGHIAISLGNGRTIEAANSRVGVVSYNAAGRFSSGGLVPGLRYGA